MTSFTDMLAAGYGFSDPAITLGAALEGGAVHPEPKVREALSLNETQTSVFTLVFKYADDSRLPLLDLSICARCSSFSAPTRGRRWSPGRSRAGAWGRARRRPLEPPSSARFRLLSEGPSVARSCGDCSECWG